ncbi:hypothetical protein Hanom_Chr01g00001391 [Helianthus anomalus]
MCRRSGDKSESALILTLFYQFRENNVKRGGWLIMHHVVALIAETQGGTCANRHLSQFPSFMCLMSKTWQNYYQAGGLPGSSISIPTG